MLDKYQTQVEQIAKELACKLDQKPEFRSAGMMFVEEQPPRVEIPTITDQISYLICLHELGHVANEDTQGRPPYQSKKAYFDKGVLRAEAAAWEFTIENCLDDIEDSSRYFMWDCLGSYYSLGYLASKGKPARLLNGNRHHVEFIYDEPDEYFTSIVKRIQGNLIDFKIEYKGAVDFTF